MPKPSVHTVTNGITSISSEGVQHQSRKRIRAHASLDLAVSEQFIALQRRHSSRAVNPKPSAHSQGTVSWVLCLVLLALLLALALGRLGANLLVVLLEGGQILARLRKLALLHTLADVVVHK